MFYSTYLDSVSAADSFSIFSYGSWTTDLILKSSCSSISASLLSNGADSIWTVLFLPLMLYDTALIDFCCSVKVGSEGFLRCFLLDGRPNTATSESLTPMIPSLITSNTSFPFDYLSGDESKLCFLWSGIEALAVWAPDLAKMFFLAFTVIDFLLWPRELKLFFLDLVFNTGSYSFVIYFKF